jgi:AraC family transcriptional regulator
MLRNSEELKTTSRRGAERPSPEHVMAVSRAIAAMNEQYADPQHLSDTARAAMYSPWHFHRVFHTVTNTTPARYLAAVRLHQAKQLLAHTNRTVDAVRATVGYQSLGSFTTQFTRLVGTSPGAYRRLVDEVAGVPLDPDSITSPGDGPMVRLATEDIDLRAASVTVIGLFSADLPQGDPETFATFCGTHIGRLAAQPRPGTYEVFGVLLPPGAQLMDIALGSLAGAHVGHRRIHIKVNAVATTIVLPLRPPCRVDPPLVSAAAALHLAAHR